MFFARDLATIPLFIGQQLAFVELHAQRWRDRLASWHMTIWLRSIGSSLGQAWQQLIGNKLRTALSLLGVSIGIFCIVAVQTAVDSLQQNVVSSLSKLGDNTFYIQRMPWADPGDDWPKLMRRPPLTFDEYEALRESLSDIGSAGYYGIVGGRSVRWRDNSVSGVFTVAGSQEVDDFFGFEFMDGRNITPMEYSRGGNVAILGYETAQDLFGGVDPVGREVRAFGQKLLVVGVLKKSGEDLLQVFNFDNALVVPYHFVAKAVNLESNVFFSSLMAKPLAGYTREDVEDIVRMTLRSERRLKPVAEDNFSVNSLDMLTSVLDAIFGVLNIVGFIVGGFAIFVGGFSVANIMFVSVKERTSLIGVKMALGASRRVILVEFLIESVALCFLGGLMGLGFVLLAIVGLNAVVPYEMSLSMGNVVLGFVLSMLIGIVAGVIPAWQASRMDPVEAIRS